MGRHSVGCLIALAAVVSGCQPESPALPVTGAITLNVVVPASGNDTYFELRNQSSRAISFRGSRMDDNRAYPWVGWTECLESATGEWTPGPYAMVDGEAGSVEVDSGRQLDVVFGFDHHRKFAEDYKGGRCRFHLKLSDGAVIISDEWRPSEPHR